MRKNLLFAGILIALLSGCHSSKHTQQTIYTVDSSAIKTLENKLQQEQELRQHVEQQLREQQYAGVQFDTLLAHDTVPGACPQNSVTITPDGGIHAQGKIKSAFFNKDRQEKTIADLWALLKQSQDSLAAERSKVHIESKAKESDVKSGMPYFWFWFWVIIVFVAGILFRHYVLPYLKLILFPIIKR